ncbi:MAG: helix-turn-helix domain-containing protein [Blastochloris viridis]|uniref:DNA-3-methyladenine glycosylase II n=1 Tax=Blastochloris viridis TaxID=1079 RepID=A0A6N4RAC2_BLAVI|nr:MAG: helix-turn-helix domain-containing protein [Blastochloris viridis]
MERDDAVFYQAYLARDARFDGVVFLGVTSTGIYCRPVCTAKTPKRDNCRFFANAESAEKAGFRPCLRCRPELAPGSAPVDDASRIAQLIVQRMEGAESLEDIAAQFDLSSRQIRRIVQSELGVSPMELILTRRLLLAKQLLTETQLPVTEIAYASGFGSLRRFNDAFVKQYKLAPTRLRKDAGETDSVEVGASSSLLLGYRPPYDWHGLLAFLSARALTGVEHVSEDTYARTVRIGGHSGWVRVQNELARHALRVEFAHSLLPVLPQVLGRLRNLFDVTARPDLINATLGQSPLLCAAVEANPGLRVPGAFDGFEMAVRAVLGQQVTVKAATTLARRFVQAFGEPLATPFEGLNHAAPTAEQVAVATVEDIAKLGIIRTRAMSILALAEACASGALKLEAGVQPETVMRQLVALPGIGPWTAQYLAMRALRWPDAFPKEDIAILNALGRPTPREAEVMSQAWRPWRSYAVLHLWKGI